MIGRADFATLRQQNATCAETTSLTPPGSLPCRQIFFMPQHRPRDPRQLVGKGYERDILMHTGEQRRQPSPERRVAFGDMGQRGPRAMDELPAQISVAPLTDPERFRLAARRRLTGDQPEPSGAEGISAPTPGIVASRRAPAFSLAKAVSSASKAAMRWSRSRHCVRASSTSLYIRSLRVCPPPSSRRTAR